MLLGVRGTCLATGRRNRLGDHVSSPILVVDSGRDHAAELVIGGRSGSHQPGSNLPSIRCVIVRSN